MKYLVTGGCGFLGSNISAEILKNGCELSVFDNLSRVGTDKNLSWLKNIGEFNFVQGDIRNGEEIEKVIKEAKPDIIFHLAGQVAMTTSIENPLMDFEINAKGSLNLLEAVRKFSPDSAVVYSSSNKVYGDLEYIKYEETATRYIASDYPEGFPENLQLDFKTPYGCSKGSADMYMIDYSKIFGLKTAVFRHSSMYGARQFSTFDQGWVGWFCAKARETQKGILKEPFTICGNGKQVRDVLFASDTAELYLKAGQNIEKIKGEVFNIGGGIENSLSLLELFDILEKELNIELNYTKLPPRLSDQKVFVADCSKIKKYMDWKPKVDKIQGIRQVLDWLAK